MLFWCFPGVCVTSTTSPTSCSLPCRRCLPFSAAAAAAIPQVCPTAAPSPTCVPRAASSRRPVVAGRAVATRHKRPTTAAGPAAAAHRGICSCSSSGSCIQAQKQQQLAVWVAVCGAQVLLLLCLVSQAAATLSHAAAKAVLSTGLQAGNGQQWSLVTRPTHSCMVGWCCWSCTITHRV
jgi:hypothetical protein